MEPKMTRHTLSHGLRFAVLTLAGAASVLVWGCGQKSAGSTATQDQITAFRGAPPTADDRKEMAEAMKRQKPVRMAPGFSSVAPAPNAPRAQ
jgi:hypothetical protein